MAPNTDSLLDGEIISEVQLPRVRAYLRVQPYGTDGGERAC